MLTQKYTYDNQLYTPQAVCALARFARSEKLVKCDAVALVWGTPNRFILSAMQRPSFSHSKHSASLLCPFIMIHKICIPATDVKLSAKRSECHNSFASARKCFARARARMSMAAYKCYHSDELKFPSDLKGKTGSGLTHA